MDTLYRQGDVLIRKVRKFDTRIMKPIERENGKVVLAHGEVTGHSHAIEAREARLFRGETPNIAYLLLEEPAVLGHEEHASISLPMGYYEVTIQREYHPQAIRNVAD